MGLSELKAFLDRNKAVHSELKQHADTYMHNVLTNAPKYDLVAHDILKGSASKPEITHISSVKVSQALNKSSNHRLKRINLRGLLKPKALAAIGRPEGEEQSPLPFEVSPVSVAGTPMRSGSSRRLTKLRYSSNSRLKAYIEPVASSSNLTPNRFSFKEAGGPKLYQERTDFESISPSKIRVSARLEARMYMTPDRRR